MYDNAGIHDILLARLRGRRALALNVYIDKEQLAGNVPKRQKARVTALRAAGAKVYACGGKDKGGAFHCKGVVVDRRFLYAGSANLTDKSLRNQEFCFKITGPAVLKVLEQLSADRARHRLWTGA